MAIWQFKLDLVPRKGILFRYNRIPTTVPESDLEDGSWLETFQPSLAEIAGVLPEAASWSEDVKIYGDNDGDNVIVCLEKGRIVWISAEIDMRGSYIQHAGVVVDLASRVDCMLLINHTLLIEPNLALLLEQIRASTAKAYVLNPERTLIDLSKLQGPSAAEKDEKGGGEARNGPKDDSGAPAAPKPGG